MGNIWTTDGRITAKINNRYVTITNKIMLEHLSLTHLLRKFVPLARDIYFI